MLQSLVLLVMIEGAPPPPLTAPEIVERLVRADKERLAALAGYTGVRRYRFENKKFNKRAELTALVACDSSGAKIFEVTAETGSGFVRSRVIRGMIDAEREASQKGEHEQTRRQPSQTGNLCSFQLVHGLNANGGMNSGPPGCADATYPASPRAPGQSSE